jgi:hypothetical protein
MTHTANATKTITKAVPTVDVDGKVIKWDVTVEYALNDYVSTFSKFADVEPTKAPADFIKAELWALVDESHLDAVFESQYISVKLAPATSTEALSDFDVDSLS